MTFYRNKIGCLTDLIDEMIEGHAPNELSFLGIIDRQDHEKSESHPSRVHHELILHDGSNIRLHVQYITGHDDDKIYDQREINDDECPFYPKGSMCFLPRLALTYVDENSIFCTFKGGDDLSGKMVDFRTDEQKAKIMVRRREEEASGSIIEPSEDMKPVIRNIGANRVCLLLDLQPSSIDAFLNINEVRYYGTFFRYFFKTFFSP